MVERDCDSRWLDAASETSSWQRSPTPKGPKLAGHVLTEMTSRSRPSSRTSSPAPSVVTPHQATAFRQQRHDKDRYGAAPPPRCHRMAYLHEPTDSPLNDSCVSADEPDAAEESQPIPEWIQSPIVNSYSSRLRETSFNIGQSHFEIGNMWSEAESSSEHPMLDEHPDEHAAVEVPACQEVITLGDSGAATPATPASPSRSAPSVPDTSRSVAVSSPGETWRTGNSPISDSRDSARLSETSTITEVSEASTRTSLNKTPLAARAPQFKSAPRQARMQPPGRKLIADAVTAVRIEKKLDKNRGLWR